MALASRENRLRVQNIRRLAEDAEQQETVIVYQDLDHAAKLMLLSLFVRCEHVSKSAICDCQRFTTSATGQPTPDLVSLLKRRSPWTFEEILAYRCTTCHHSAAHHLSSFRTEARNVLQDLSRLDDCTRLAIDRFNLISYYAQCSPLEKRPYYTLFKLVDAKLYDSGELQYIYEKPPFELPTIDVLIGNVLEENKHWELFGQHLLEKLDQYIWPKPSPASDLLYGHFYELYLAYCLIPKKVPSLVTFKVGHVFGYFALKAIFADLKTYLQQNFDLDPSLKPAHEQFLSDLHDSLEPGPGRHDLFRSRIKFDRPRLNSQFLANYGLKVNFAGYHATSKLSFMPAAFLKRSRRDGILLSGGGSPPANAKKMRLRNHAGGGGEPPDGQGCTLYQTRDMIFQRCNCLEHRDTDHTIYYTSISYNRELVEERTLRSKVQMILLVDYERLIQEHLPRIDVQYIHDKLFDKRYNHIVIFQRGKLIGGCTYAFHTAREIKFCEIIFMAVHASKQLQGFGTKMMSLLRFCVSTFIHYKSYVTYADMDALGFYQKQGFDDIPDQDAQPYVEVLGQFDRARLMKYDERSIVRAANLGFEYYEPTLAGYPADCPVHQCNERAPSLRSLLSFHATVSVNRPIWYLVHVVKALRAQRKRFMEISFQNFERIEPMLRDVKTIICWEGEQPDPGDLPAYRALYYCLLRFVRECQLKTDPGSPENRIAYAVDAKLKRLYSQYFGTHEYY